MTSNAAPSVTVEQLIREGAQRLADAGVYFGHGTDNAVDEAAELVFFASGLRHEDAAQVYGTALSQTQVDATRALFERRIREQQGIWIRIANVFAGKYHHPASDEFHILTSL